MHTTSIFRLAVISLTCASLGIGNIEPVLATDISQIPLAVKSRAKPAFIFALDDSGSMDSEILLPTNDGAAWYHTGDDSFVGRNSSDAVATGVINYNRVGSSSSTWKKYVYLFPNGVNSGDGRRVYGDSTDDHYAVPPTTEFAWFRSSTYNPIYYDPKQTYTPWEPAHDGTNLITYGNITASAAPTHPGQSQTANTTDLTATISSNSTGFLFRIHQGMVWTTTGATCFSDSAGTTIRTCNSPASGDYYAQIPYWPATYYVADSTCTSSTCPALAPNGTTRLRKVEIRSTTTSYEFCGTGCSRTYAQELQNFANWFSYYRKRRLLLNAAFGSALIGIENLRAGQFRFNSLPSSVVMYDFNTTNDKQKFLYGVYSLDTTGGTPTRPALNKIGELFDTQTGANAPILNQCQYNAGFVLTDGFANTTLPTFQPGNVDGQTVSASYPYGGIAPHTDSYSNTLADYSMYYYTKRLRTDLAAGKVPINTYDTSPSADLNRNLHMNTYALTIGAKGTIYGVNTNQTNDPYTYTPTWPNPNTDRNPTAVDDLFHATVNGRGDMFTATNVSELAAGIQEAINRVFAKLGAAAAGTVQNPNVTSSENDYFESTYNSGNWTGEIVSRDLDPTTGAISTSTLWQAQSQLDSRTSASRYIATYSGTTGVAFTSAGIGSANLSTFASPTTPPGPSDGAAVIDYLRGVRTGETSGIYRTRAHLLGDIVNAEPVIIRRPYHSYADTGYDNFARSNASTTRTRIVLQGANDGMLHAFNAASGAEEWAYVPKLVWNNLKYLSQRMDFVHRYFVDSTPVYDDIDYQKTDGATGGGTDWATLVVGGLGAGGKGYYALDVTTTTASNEAGVVSKVKWEFPNTSTATDNVGLSYGKPSIVKRSDGNWVVLVTSGYNNNTGTGDGIGRLYILNPRTGAIISSISTGTGTASAPSGLGPLSVYVENADVDNTAIAAYAGDLQGNVWHFNLDTLTATKIAHLADSYGLAQPITAAPELATFTVNGTRKHAVIVGTGQYLGDSDIPGSASANANATQTQTVYVLIVDPASPSEITPIRTSLGAQTVTTSGTTMTATATSVNLCGANAMHGWYADLPTAGQRVVTDVTLAQRRALITVNLPNNDVCSPGGQSWYMEMAYSPNSSGCTINVDTSFSYLGNALGSRVVVAQLASGQVIGLIRKSDTTTEKINVGTPGTASGTKRISWRELIAK